MTIAVLIGFLLAIKNPAIIVYAAHVLSLPITSNLTSWLFANIPHLNNMLQTCRLSSMSKSLFSRDPVLYWRITSKEHTGIQCSLLSSASTFQDISEESESEMSQPGDLDTSAYTVEDESSYRKL